MLTREDITRYRQNLNNEREAIHLYTCLADKEENPELASVYRKLAQTEFRHAATWEELLKRAGEPVPVFRPG
jgi:vacuolar iron transporter family protein